MRPFLSNKLIATVFNRADYADDEYIQELLAWRNPHTVQTDDFKYSEKENMAMLNLPRKECELSSSTKWIIYLDFNTRFSDRGTNKTAISYVADAVIFLRV